MSSGRRTNGEGTYTARPGGRWQYRVEVDGRRIVATGRTKTEAKARARERAKVLGERRTRVTLKALVDDWSKLSPERIGLAASTADQYRALMASQVVPRLGDVELERLTRRQVADLFDAMTAAASTRRSTYAALVKVLDHAVAAGLLRGNVARDVPRPQAGPARRRDIDDKAARAFIAAAQADERLGVAAWLGFGCGLRRGEMLGLRWADVDLDAAVLTVTPDGNVTRTSAGLRPGRPKTRKGVRQVPIPAPAAAALKAHRRRQAAARLASPVWVDSGHVLVNEVGGMVEPRALSRAWQGWAKAAGLPDTGTHVGRHYAATALLASGRASVADVAAQLGHDPAVLLTTYAVAVADGQRAAADALGAALSAPVSAPVVPGTDGPARTGTDGESLGDNEADTGTD